jgi:SAM-dependent methyltransferase
VRGFAQSLRMSYRRLRDVFERQHDRRLGITTVDAQVASRTGHDGSGLIPPDGTGLSGATGRGLFYRALFYAAARRLMARLDAQPSDALLDVGCGAGRVVCIAAHYPFARIIGIEIDPALCELAQQNARALRQCRTRPEIVCADVTTYRVPDEITVVFLYNTCSGKLLREALTRVLESYDRNPRRLRVAYCNPREHELVMSMRRFVPTSRIHFSWRPEKNWQRTQAVQFYEVQPDMRDAAVTACTAVGS